ncbi:MAG TPA: phytoene desaturase [Candidatus Binatia bacterium]|nr:phytoene desaturase [Candidatus Binatia bacterium]
MRKRTDKPRAAVIGSGFGGLAVAVRLQAAGINTVIFEKRDLPGGRAYVYRDAGFTFDAGPTVITAPDCLRELFALSGRVMDDYISLLPVSPFYRLFWDDGFRFDYSNDTAQIEAQIAATSPRDVSGYKRFLTYSEEVFHQGYENLAHVPFLNWSSMIAVAPQLVRLQAYRSVYGMVGKYIKDPHLRQLFSFHSLLVGGNPFTTTSIYTLIHCLERKWGVFFPRGGTGALVQALVKLFTELGGEVRLNSEVRRIDTLAARVTGIVTDAGNEPFDLVVSNADVVHTYDRLLQHESAVRGACRRLERMAYSMSLFIIYFGTRRQYPNLLHHNILFGPRYRELLNDIFARGRLPADFSLYLHRPTHSDPHLAPPECDAFYVLSPVAHLGKLPIDWEREGPRYAATIMEYLERRYMADLRRNIVTQRLFTPEDFKNELNAHFGSAFSLEPRLTQSAFFRVHNRDRNLRGLYFVGAGTHPGAGVPGVVNSAKATAGLIAKDFAAALEPGSVRTEQVSYA